MSQLVFFVLGALLTLTLGFGWHAHRGRFGHGAWTPEHVREGGELGPPRRRRQRRPGRGHRRHRRRHRGRPRAGARAPPRAARGSREALAAPEIDRAKLDEIRSEAIALADETSGRVVAALADASAQLTPEQRNELLERHERHHERWHGSR